MFFCLLLALNSIRLQSERQQGIVLVLTAAV